MTRTSAGACVWLTGLSGAGKTTIAEALALEFQQRGRMTTVLNGDVVRTHLSKGLGFSKSDRDTNVLRIAFVASEIVRHRGVVICAAVSPYDARRMPEDGGRRLCRSVRRHTAQSVRSTRHERDVCQSAAGRIQHFTGIDDPYEPPTAPDVHVHTDGETSDESARVVLNYPVAKGFVA